MKEHPILFSGPMVRAILSGRKTQTRRVMLPQPPLTADGDVRDSVDGVGFYTPAKVDRRGEIYPGAEVFGCWGEEWSRRCPYGAPGDRLWVREAWGGIFAHPETRHLLQASEVPAVARTKDNNHGLFYAADDLGVDYTGCLRPSIHMPRWASRLALEIVDVRVERLQDIDSRDIEEEGAMTLPEWTGPEAFTLQDLWIKLWDSINAARGFGWDANPWVWAVTFKRVEVPNA